MVKVGGGAYSKLGCCVVQTPKYKIFSSFRYGDSFLVALLVQAIVTEALP